ncbi:carbohydrate-binding module family 13 protein [Coniophora puteana RWD-64-598 SS2]|uniref:Carbohydrate-binding module family 13 protein n=1 Tax=Coniophora puteana (strain RWD-64-598) TaxID=741705 RepID=A0A5M3MIB9_CONPW|nr:carbohydrate-binding module family 13 protein [Coniophora puteana RWD-64-598 SS2]EIW78989.1 carbohydrate-binding module family 13 protein [Coniophora puteana RWD-64-598 SS2]
MQTTPIRPGTYLLLQFGGRMAMDLTNKHTVTGYTKHEKNNQKWEISPFGAGYSIKSVTGPIERYVACETDTSVSTKPYPVSWRIESISRNEETNFQIVWPNSQLAITLTSSDPGTKVRLAPVGDPGQEWTTRRVGEVRTNVAPGAPMTTQSTYTLSSSDSEPAIRIEGAGSHPTIVINDRNTIPENGELVFTTTTTWSNTMTSTVTKFERIMK